MQNRTKTSAFVMAIGVCVVKESDSRYNLERQGRGKNGRKLGSKVFAL